MTESFDWKSRIVELVIVKQAIDELDTRGLWEYRLPAVAATPERLGEVEAKLGEPLDPGCRSFLEHANGWPAFWQSVDLFGVEDLLGSERFEHASAMLSYVEDSVLDAGRLRRADVLPIAGSPVDLDLFVMTGRSSPSPGGVVWLAGTEVDRFSSFKEFFVAMVQYNRLDLDHLRGAAGA